MNAPFQYCLLKYHHFRREEWLTFGVLVLFPEQRQVRFLSPDKLRRLRQAFTDAPEKLLAAWLKSFEWQAEHLSQKPEIFANYDLERDGQAFVESYFLAPDSSALQFDGITLTTLFGPRWRLLLIGAGQLSQAVAQLATLLDFEVLVCDPREEYASTLDIQSVTRLKGMPDDAVLALKPDAHTAIVALTHDAKLDDMALLEALNSDAFYVGALGSRRNQAARKQRLMKHFDMSADSLDRLQGPGGLSIGAKTPAEIAVSIIAQIVQMKNTLATVPVAAASCLVNL